MNKPFKVERYGYAREWAIIGNHPGIDVCGPLLYGNDKKQAMADCKELNLKAAVCDDRGYIIEDE